MLVRGIVAALAALPSPPPRPAPAQYRIEQRTESRIDLSVFGAPEQVQQSAYAWYVSIAYTDSAAGAALVATLDSLQVDLGTNPVTQQSIDSAAGTVYRGHVDANRKVQSLTASKPSTFGAQFEALLRSFHPVWRPDAGTGDAWVDTLDVQLNTPTLTTTSRSIRHYSVAGTEVHDGVEAVKLDVRFAETSSGTLETPGGPAQLEGTTTGTGVAYLGPGGKFLGGRSSSTGEGTVTVATAPSAIPVRSTTTTTVTLFR